MANQHRWDVSAKEGRAIQERLQGQVETGDRFGAVSTVAGVDVGFEDSNRVARAAIAVLDFPSLQLREHTIARAPVRFPYVPGLLSFRELPAILQALEQLTMQPHLLLCDGQGVAHPRRLGIASHLGVLIDMPTIGVAKSRLTGEDREPPITKGSWVNLVDRGEVIGAILRTRAEVKPLYISVGHRLSLPSAISFVLACTTRYRLPETTRWAHRFASGPAIASDRV